MERATVRYRYEGHEAGPRSGRVPADRTDVSNCWVAHLPKLRINESGSYQAEFLLVPLPRSRATADPRQAVLVEFMEGWARLASGQKATERAPEIARAAVDSVFVPGQSIVVWEEEGKEPVPLTDALSQQVSGDLAVQDVYGEVNRPGFIGDPLA